MKKLYPLCAIILTTALVYNPAWAQTAPSPSALQTPLAMKDASDAEIRKFDKDAKKITLKHGPIKNLDMPGMTMVFQVKDTVLLEKLALWTPGDKIRFTAEQQLGAFVITAAEKATPP